MHHESLFVLLAAQVLVPFHILECAVYPSIQWTPQNPLFNRNDSTLYVLPMTQVHVVCPNPATVMRKVQDNTPKDKLYQNLWIVSREGYRHCATNYTRTSRLLLRCNTPLVLKYYTLVFHKYSAAPGGLIFRPGKEYYLIATSDGSSSSMNRKSGGNCKHKNMKLKVYVCKDKSDQRCKPQLTSSPLLSSKTTTITTSTTTATAATSFTTTSPSQQPPHTTNSTTHAHTEGSTRRSTWLSSEPISGTDLKTTGANSTKAPSTESSRDPIWGKQTSPTDAVSQMNWTVLIPVLVCLVLSMMGNIILAYRLRLRQQRQDHKITDSTVIGRSEQQKIQSRLDKALLLCRRSADVTEV